MGSGNMRNRDFRETRTPLGVIGGFVGLIAASIGVAMLIVAGVTPAIATVGIAASGSIGMFENLPGYLEIDELSEKSNIYATASDGSTQLLASFYDQNRVEVGWDAINQYAKDAAIAGEDPRFYDHGGVDLQGTIRAAVKTATGGRTQGGSSIAQQYVKNVRVQECEAEAHVTAVADLTEDERAALTYDDRRALVDAAKNDCYEAATESDGSAGIERKLKEMRLAIGVEKRYSKSEILLGYLNIAGFGGTVYGIEAAANYYFSTTAANLTLAQAASLLAIVNNPVEFQLDKPESETNGAANGYARNKDRRDYILFHMLEEKKITREEYDVAIATPVEPAIQEPSTGCQTANESAYFCDYVKHILQTDPAFGEDAETRMRNFKRGGYDVYTTLDLDLQSAAVTAIAQNVPQVYPGWDVGGVISSVQVGTGRVLAMAQNKIYSQDPNVLAIGPEYESVNYNTDYTQGGSSGFQPGSTYKVFTLAQWLNEGHTLNERVDSKPKSNWGTFQDSCNGPVNTNAEGFAPKNDANEAGGNYSALESTLGSINTGFIGMAKRLDLCGIRKTAEAFGMHRADGDPLLQSPATVLGTNEVAPLSLAVAFAGIANNGVTCTPVAIDKIVDRDGNEVPVPTSTCAPAVTPEVAAAMHYAMQGVMTGGTATESNRNVDPHVPLIGKTGTTDGNKDTWMAGASSKVATVAGVVSLYGDANQRAIGGFGNGTAATARHRMWPMVMSVAAAKYGGDPFSIIGPGQQVAPSVGPVPGTDSPEPSTQVQGLDGDESSDGWPDAGEDVEGPDDNGRRGGPGRGDDRGH